MEHPEAEKLFCSLMENGYGDIANKIADKMKLSLDADVAQREKWMKCTLEELEKCMDDNSIKKIRKGCVCSLKSESRIPGYKEIYDRTKARKERYRKLYMASSSLEEFVAEVKKIEDEPGKPSVELTNGKLYKYFYFCPCPFLKDSTSIVPRSWCYCTLGNSEDTFSYAFDKEVHGNLLESIKMGDSRCTIEIQL